ncbi:MAG: AIR synthase-related protein [Candidatus Bathyarchaeota archaeon]|nr:AIR synthase-related protein [Candidatus Termiticorpusculum sp.]
MGKLSSLHLQKLLDCIRASENVVVPPMIGYDAGVHRLGDQLLVVSTDPCTGVPQEWFGWFLINYAASDLSLFGAKPQFCTINLLGPRSTSPEVFQEIMKQTCVAADEYGVAIVRGHTGMYDSLKDMLGVCTMYGTVEPDKLVTPGNAKPGDLIMCTKPVGIETLTNFALTHPKTATKIFGAKKVRELADMIKLQSCVKEAQQLAQAKCVNAMHDATEGGVVAALNELAEASNIGMRVNWENIPFPKELAALKEQFKLSDYEVLALSSTGTILVAVPPTEKQKATEVLKQHGLCAYFIGEFTEDKKRILKKAGEENIFPLNSKDAYTRLLAIKKDY